MKWTVQQLQQAKREPLQFEQVVELDEIKERNDEIRSISPVTVSGTISYVNKVFIVDFQAKGELILPCARTLVDVKYPFDLEIIERFQEADGYAISDEENEISHITGESLDLKPCLQDHILLDIPMVLIAENVDEPVAPPTGKGWQLVTEEEKKDKVDPRLADLAKFFDKK